MAEAKGRIGANAGVAAPWSRMGTSLYTRTTALPFRPRVEKMLVSHGCRGCRRSWDARRGVGDW